MTEPDPAPVSDRPGLLLAAVGIAAVEALAVLVYAVAIAVSALQNPGSIAAPPVEIAIYLAFAVGIGACGVGLWRRLAVARTPFGVVQLFGVVVGYTLLQGDGDLVHRVGYVVLGLSVVGIAVVLSPVLAETLDG